MAFELTWYIPKRVLYSRLYDYLTPDDLLEGKAQWQVYLDQIDQPVHHLIDLSAVIQARLGLRSIASAMGSIYKNPHVGAQIYFGSQDAFLQYLAAGVASVYNLESPFLATRREALLYLLGRDPSLRDQIPPQDQALITATV